MTMTDVYAAAPRPTGISRSSNDRCDEGVRHASTEVRALDGVTVAFETARFSAIMGPSGSGKSTLLHCIAGLDTLTSGKAFIGDVDLSTLDDNHLTELRRDRVGFIFQSFNLVPTLTAFENITLPLRLAGRKGDSEWIDRIVETVGLEDRLRHRPTELSGGQQQRVAIARALASKPQIIFADEPTGNLDSHSGAEVLSFMQRAVREDEPDDRDGDARPDGSELRRPGHLPRRRQDRRGDARAHC